LSSISDRLAVTAAACDAVSARYAELVRGELDALPLGRAVLAAFADHVRAEGAGSSPTSAAVRAGSARTWRDSGSTSPGSTCRRR
jgi:hypothetical protein